MHVAQSLDSREILLSVCWVAIRPIAVRHSPSGCERSSRPPRAGDEGATGEGGPLNFLFRQGVGHCATQKDRFVWEMTDQAARVETGLSEAIAEPDEPDMHRTYWNQMDLLAKESIIHPADARSEWECVG